VKLTLPYPPSTNRLWRCPTRGPLRGRHMLSKEARAYKDEVGILAQSFFLSAILGPVGIRLLVHPPDKRRRDLDNTLKAILDSLTGHAYTDDSQIARLEVERGEVERPHGSVEVSVWPLVEP